MREQDQEALQIQAFLSSQQAASAQHKHPGAEAAAAAVGLALDHRREDEGIGGGSGGAVRYFRQQEELKNQARQAFLKSDAAPPTVGLIQKGAQVLPAQRFD